MEDLYKILEVDKKSSKEDIKKAYYKKAKKFHPDKNNGKDTDKFKEISLAYNVLSDPERRKRYDENGDTNPEKPDNTKVREILVKMLYDILIKNNDITNIDIFAIMRETVSQTKRTIKDNIKNSENQIEKFQDLKKRIKKDNEGFFEGIINQSIEASKITISKLNKELEINEKVSLFIKDCKYKKDNTIHGIEINWNSFTSATYS